MKITIIKGVPVEKLVLELKILSSSSVAAFDASGDSKRCFDRSVTANIVSRVTKKMYVKKFNQNNGFPKVDHFH